MCQMHQAAQKFHRKNERQEVTGALLKQMDSRSIREPLCLSPCLCLHLILGGEKKKSQGAEEGLRFHSDPRNEITNSIITRMLHGSRANRLR